MPCLPFTSSASVLKSPYEHLFSFCLATLARISRLKQHFIIIKYYQLLSISINYYLSINFAAAGITVTKVSEFLLEKQIITTRISHAKRTIRTPRIAVRSEARDAYRKNTTVRCLPQNIQSHIK